MTHTASSDGRYDVLAEACPTRQVVNRIGDRWSLLVLYALEAARSGSPTCAAP